MDTKHLWLLLLLSLGFVSCQDWGLMDPPAGNQQLPNLTKVASYTFDDLGLDLSIGVYQGGKTPKLVADSQLDVVLELDGSYVSYQNPLQFSTLQDGISFTGWVKLNEEDPNSSLFAFGDENGNNLVFYGNSTVYYNDITISDDEFVLTPNEWHWIAFQIKADGIILNIDGNNVKTLVSGEYVSARNADGVNYSDILDFITNQASKIYFGYGAVEKPVKMWWSTVSVYKNSITEKEIARPVLRDPSEPDAGGDDEEKTITVGAEDCSSAFFTEFSPLMKHDGDCIFHYKFVNHTDGMANWNNWILAVTNGKANGEEGYKEHLILRADAYGWGDCYVQENVVSNYNWDTFTKDMEGATVDLTIKRIGANLEMDAIVTTTNGTVYNYSYTCGNVPFGEIGVFLSVEKAYLVIDPKETYTGSAWVKGVNVVGMQDCSTGWWTAFSQGITGNVGDTRLNLKFYNHTSGNENWHNYVVVVTNGTNYGDSGYAGDCEYVVLRADAYGWGTYYNSEGFINQPFTFPDPFRSQMQNAYVDMTVERTGSVITVDSNITTESGENLKYTYSSDGIPADTPLGAFLTVEGGYLEVISLSTYPFMTNE